MQLLHAKSFTSRRRVARPLELLLLLPSANAPRQPTERPACDASSVRTAVPGFALAATSDFKRERTMAFAGLVVTFAGFLVAASSVGVMSSAGGRLVMVLVGIAISLFGIIGVLNPCYQKDAIWKK